MSHIVLTGAGGDIGGALSRSLISAGHQVSGLDIAADRLLRQNLGPDFHSNPCDVRSMASVVEAMARARAAFGPIDALINNAGAITAPSLVKTDEVEWLADIDLNLNGAWRCIRAVQDEMIARASGVIVNIASINALGVYGHPGYSVAKAGLVHLTRFCATEFGKWGVRSVALCPGTVKTQAWHARAATQPEILAEAASWYPSRDVSEPGGVAHLVMLAIDPAMTQLNGAIIALDGGLTCGSDRVASVFAGEVI